MATTISVIGLLLAAIIFVVAIWKGLDVFTSTILVSFIIIMTSWMDWWTSLSSYAEGYVGFIQNNVFVLVIRAVFGELMAASGCAESIANVVTEKMGAKRVILSIALITTVFVCGSIRICSTFRTGTDRNDHDEAGRIPIPYDSGNHLYRSNLLSNDPVCHQYYKHHAGTVSRNFHGIRTDPWMGRFRGIFCSGIFLHGSCSKNSSDQRGNSNR